MKLVSFITAAGNKSFGIHRSGGIIDLSKRTGDDIKDLKDFLAVNGIEYAETLQGEPPDFPDTDIIFLPVIENPGKIICAGMNYQQKRDEFAQNNPAPTLFIRFPDSQTAHNGQVLKPRNSDQLDYEGELAVVIGRAGKNIPAERAGEYIAGYSCYMDGSVRDWQHSWFTAGKNWDRTGGFGPWLVTPPAVGTPQSLAITTWLNGVVVQHDNTANMIHPINELIEYISTFTRLSPGDIILTGSPGGVGKTRTPPLFLQDGDEHL